MTSLRVSHPTDGFLRSVKSHNCRLVLTADWLETAVLLFDDLDGDGVTLQECVDYFVEEQLYDSQDFCAEFFESVFSEIRIRRQIHGDSYPVSIDANLRLSANQNWSDNLALSFCLLLSVLPFYSGYTEWVGGHYEAQGKLFEEITVCSLRRWFPGWDVTRTGWGGGTGTPLDKLLQSIADTTEEVVRAEATVFVSNQEKDLGMDVAAVRRFSDGRSSLPVVFGQCASGQDWPRKLGTPDASRWKQLLTLTHTPLRAFSLPFRLTDDEYNNRRSQHKGLLMDRLRLLPRDPEADWLDHTLDAELHAWIVPRIQWLEQSYSLVTA